MRLSTKIVGDGLSQSVITRRRKGFGVIVLLLPLIGLGMRANTTQLPAFIALYTPDALWALLVFAVIVFLAPRLRTSQAIAMALIFAFLIECSQLYQAPWINSLRATRAGGLVLGFGFLWSDLLCYIVGILLGAGVDYMLGSMQLNRKVSL